jgi:hypothetical protein
MAEQDGNDVAGVLLRDGLSDLPGHVLLHQHPVRCLKRNPGKRQNVGVTLSISLGSLFKTFVFILNKKSKFPKTVLDRQSFG